MRPARQLVVVADDYGIGPATSRGILRLCQAGVVTGTVLLVNSPFAEECVRLWRKAGVDADLGWHPCLTLDAPVLPAAEVPSLVESDGRFCRLGKLMARLAFGQVNVGDIHSEMAAQLDRFRELTGTWPGVVNSHHHVQVFPAVGAAMRRALAGRRVATFVRRVQEPLRTLFGVPGARGKRQFLNALGRREARRQAADGYAGNEWLAGITDPRCVSDSRFFDRWLTATPGRLVELTCHPGEDDPTLIGRDAEPGDGHRERRPRELELLSRPGFREVCDRASFRLVRPSKAAFSELAAAG